MFPISIYLICQFYSVLSFYNFLYNPSKKQTKNVLDNVIEKSKQCREIVTSLPPQKK